MGLLDNNVTTTYIEGKVDLKELYEVLKEKLGDKYQVKYLEKGNVAQQMMGGESFDQIFIAKNAYHRTLISTLVVPTLDLTKEETILTFNRETLKWWLNILHSQTGFIGATIIRTIYGSNIPFDQDILEALKSKFPLKERTQNMGISTLWKKDNSNEIKN
ncbi:hypothetical protein [Capnocytophaga catalasegens]|uniref:Uncharacterized protein n=1 Tax=Capnocytophaga catalasegens TaxID=1004260 RepID=A0AAV5AYJ0_9FLAO|nr:hypothetical protein [Capnocytophaga catalasegens]GIZ15348.1 hypothetical protein RCZ03_13480 [Capnocytophaga catalasegens]GJM50515.1 hypothetical protein RCZ15_14880 [Capnocytophaga catalasegens]GJM52119.1 hypothetical protein RCZ16_04370 [Capnocytophaga catalasegens]